MGCFGEGRGPWAALLRGCGHLTPPAGGGRLGWRSGAGEPALPFAAVASAFAGGEGGSGLAAAAGAGLSQLTVLISLSLSPPRVRRPPLRPPCAAGVPEWRGRGGGGRERPAGGRAFGGTSCGIRASPGRGRFPARSRRLRGTAGRGCPAGAGTAVRGPGCAARLFPT